MEPHMKRKTNELLVKSGKYLEELISQIDSYHPVERSTIRYTLRKFFMWMRKRRLSKLCRENGQAVESLRLGDDYLATMHLRKVGEMRGPIRSSFANGKSSISHPIRMKIFTKSHRPE